MSDNDDAQSHSSHLPLYAWLADAGRDADESPASPDPPNEQQIDPLEIVDVDPPVINENAVGGEIEVLADNAAIILSSDDDSSLSDLDEPHRWLQRDPRIHQAIQELLQQSRRSDDANAATAAGDAGARRTGGFRDNFFLQRLRRVVFNLSNNRRFRNRGNNDEHNQNDNDEDMDETPTVRDIPITFDTNLAAEHAYLGGDMNRVSGVNYLEVGKRYNMLLFIHQHVLFPGELLPFIDYGSINESDIDATDGFLFGVCFPNVRGPNDSEDILYGVTCQVFEKGNDEHNNMRIKSRVLQRFVTSDTQFKGPISYIGSHQNFKCYGLVRILPEIYLPEPLDCLRMGSMSRFRDSTSYQNIYRRFQECTAPLPSFVYDNYDMKSILATARTKLEAQKIDTMPTDPVQISFWLVRNLHLPEAVMKSVFLSDCVNIRMKLIANTFTEDLIYICRYCGNRIAKCSELFAMSKYGVQTQYCNSAGYIHETNTVYQLLRHAISFSGQPSSEFSWFPGYQWQIVICKVCSRHIGWQFKALEESLVPRSFYGISSSSVRVTTSKSQADLSATFMRNFSDRVMRINQPDEV